jgi:hypothetical protein
MGGEATVGAARVTGSAADANALAGASGRLNVGGTFGIC